MDITQFVLSQDGLSECLKMVVRHFGADSGTVHRLGPDGQLHLAALFGDLPAPVLETIQTIPVGKGMAGLAVAQRRPVDACNIQTDTSGSVRPGARATGLAGAIVVPLMRGDEAVGALGIANREERRFTEAEIEELLETGRAFAVMLAAGSPA